MKLIGLSGTNGSGKDTIGHMLAERYKFLFISLTDMLRDEARERGEEPTREVLRTISAEWRRESGSLGVLVDKAVEQYKKVKSTYPGGLVVASIRNPGEVETIHGLEGIVIWADADPKIRYKRIQANKATRGRKEEDEKTFDQFLAEEQAEMTSSGDKATLNMSEVKAKADLTITNDGNEIESFKDEAEKVLSKYLNS